MLKACVVLCCRRKLYTAGKDSRLVLFFSSCPGLRIKPIVSDNGWEGGGGNKTNQSKAESVTWVYINFHL